ncbi:heme/hemin ABC transporter substrate-binding protein [Roseibium marinum]|uniref:Iron complex transport system substrate-binding protein n=1 Tax=Roseibium marinum TaxID=281252 RepID=A0A2S3UKX9_9HYPH|nr:ABC transporter substrate-binding protein [Roseibium marinum]POF28382.1 iron complex transport system substrate-binding protein [Roseibium marinum]
MKTLLHSRLYGVAVATALTAAALVTPAKSLFAEGTQQSSAKRIVAVGGSVTEVVYALGEEGRLIARDSTSTYPEEALELPDVGYMRALSPEGVLSVEPELILMLEGSGPRETVDLLQQSGIAIANIPHAFTAEGIVAKVRAIGAALAVPEKAEELALKLETDLEAARSKAAGQTSGVRVLFILSTNGGRILASGSDTAADGILKLAGAQNAVADFSGYKQLSDEAIISAAPDVVLMMARNGNHGAGADELFSHPALAQTPAGRNNRLITMGGQYLLGFGPRTADAVGDLAVELSSVRN